MSGFKIGLTAALALALVSRIGNASPLFPAMVARTLDVPPPGCPLCHTTEEGLRDTATRPFARTLVRYGLMQTDTATLGSILDQMKERGTDDSDRDGVGDIAEIQQGRDPNVNDITGLPPDDYPPPIFGCAVRAPSTASLFGATGGACAAWAVIAAVSLRVRARRRS